MSDVIERYRQDGWEPITPTRLGFVNGNPELIARITVLRRGTEEIVVFVSSDGHLIGSQLRKYSKH